MMGREESSEKGAVLCVENNNPRVGDKVRKIKETLTHQNKCRPHHNLTIGIVYEQIFYICYTITTTYLTELKGAIMEKEKTKSPRINKKRFRRSPNFVFLQCKESFTQNLRTQNVLKFNSV